jgi:hypothetical protein
LGWLAATIQNEDRSRGQRYLDAGVSLPLVEIEAGDYLLDIMQQLGPIRSLGMGLMVPDWQEIAAFAEAFRLRLEPWEFRLIRRMCSAYLREFDAGKEPLSMPPIEREITY